MGSVTTTEWYASEFEVELHHKKEGYLWYHGTDEALDKYTMVYLCPWSDEDMVNCTFLVDGHITEEEIKAEVLRFKIENRG